MIKYNNDSGAVEGMLILLIFSLAFSSLTIAWVLQQSYGYNVVGDESIIRLPESGAVNPEQNYQTNEISYSANYVNSLGKYIFNPGIGTVLTNGGGLESRLLLKGVQPLNDIYTVTYKINNSVHKEFWVEPRYFAPANFYNIHVKFAEDGVHIQNFEGLTDKKFCAFSNLMTKDKLTIKTEFAKKAGNLKVYVDNVLACEESGYWDILSTMEGSGYYAGVMSKTDGFTVEFIGAGSIHLSSSTDILSQISLFIEIVLKIVVWNVNPLFLPWELNFMFIKTQLAGIIVCIIVIIRG